VTIWYEGDACRPKWDEDHPVMFVYDFEPGNFKRPKCNWLVNAVMFKRTFNANELVRACREEAER